MTVQSVKRGSYAKRAGVAAGDVLLSVNGHPMGDVFDYRFYTAEQDLTLSLCREGRTFDVTVQKRREEDDLGLVFASALMDEKRSCRNGCVFCFIDQLPKGMRSSLYFKDDDTRLSFLHGNYVTLTNLTEKDVTRIIDMHMSPVNVSVHTTDPALRVAMMKNKRAGEVLSYLRRFADAGLVIRGQIVLCKGINDGEHLKKTMADLAELFPALDSVSVVPVGLTDHREGLYPLSPFTGEEAAEVLETVESFADRFQQEHGSRLFFCADEFYLKAQKPLPKEDDYEGYPQLDNGVGMLRSLWEEVQFSLNAMPFKPHRRPRRVSIATGLAAAPMLRDIANLCMQKDPHLSVQVYAIENRFFGKNITVAGLLTGKDITEQLKGKDLGDCLLISKNMLRSGEDVLLDDMTVSDIARTLKVKTVPVADDGRSLHAAIWGKKIK